MDKSVQYFHYDTLICGIRQERVHRHVGGGARKFPGVHVLVVNLGDLPKVVGCRPPGGNVIGWLWGIAHPEFPQIRACGTTGRGAAVCLKHGDCTTNVQNRVKSSRCFLRHLFKLLKNKALRLFF